MSLVGLINAAHAVLIEDLDEEGVRVLDDSLNGRVRPRETQEEAFVRARSPRPSRGAPRPADPNVRPQGIPLAPPGVIVREPEPTRGLDVLHAALAGAPKPSRAKPAVPKR